MLKDGDKIICIDVSMTNSSITNEKLICFLEANKIYTVKSVSIYPVSDDKILHKYVKLYEIPNKLYKIERFKTIGQIRKYKINKLMNNA